MVFVGGRGGGGWFFFGGVALGTSLLDGASAGIHRRECLARVLCPLNNVSEVHGYSLIDGGGGPSHFYWRSVRYSLALLRSLKKLEASAVVSPVMVGLFLSGWYLRASCR